jgi:hypothetical protein
VQLTTAHKRILWEHFKGAKCPVCGTRKQSRQCFCRSCYFALKTADPKLAAGLYARILDDEPFFENYARAKEWLEERGHNAGWNTTPKSGDLFA